MVGRRHEREVGLVVDEAVEGREQRLAPGQVETGAGLLKVNWQTAAPLSEHEQLEMMVTRRRDLGLPLATTLRLAGFDPTEIAAILEEEEEEALRRAARFNAGDMDARREDDLPARAGSVGARRERAA